MKRDIALACSLSSNGMAVRIEEFRALGARTTSGELSDGTLLLRFPHEEGLTETLADLVRREKACCPFLDFRIEESPRQIQLLVSGPLEAQPVLESFLQS